MKTTARRSHFLFAAELVFLVSTGKLGFLLDLDSWPSRYCCDNLNRVDAFARKDYSKRGSNPESLFFKKMFLTPDVIPDWHGGWWEHSPEGEPNEPRILAMLLCAEMLRR